MPIRWFVWPLIAIVLAITLFQVKHSARKMERELTETIKKIEQREQQIETLKAEWSLLNQPGYLASLAGRYLDYHPEQRTRIRHVRDIPLRTETETAAADVPSPARRPQRSTRSTQQAGAQTVSATVDENGDVIRHLTSDDRLGSLIEQMSGEFN